VTQSGHSDLWVKADIALWAVVLGGAAWVISRGDGATSFGAIFFAWAAFRLAGSVALSRVEVVRAAGESRLEAAAGWLYFSRTAATGAFFIALGVDAIATQERAGVAFGLIACAVGVPFVLLGIKLMHEWAERSEERSV
jgi:hypothetical protein